MVKRRLLQSLIAASALAFPVEAGAGDVANLNILGFSRDGGIFAFEEFGVQDGSGFPYANRYYIRTSDDKFLPGTPIRVRLDDESADVRKARGEAATKAQSATSLSDAELLANSGNTVALNPVTELSANPMAVKVNPRPIFPALDPVLAISLDEFPLAAGSNCQNIGDIKGFRLTLQEETPNAAPSTIHEDSSVPASRGCPLGYSIGAVQTFYPQSGAPVVAVMIAIRGQGFEGPDYRWLAVTRQR
jgi:predicted secreted protein